MSTETKVHVLKFSRESARLIIDLSIVGCVLFGMAITGSAAPMLGLCLIIIRRIGGAAYDEEHGLEQHN